MSLASKLSAQVLQISSSLTGINGISGAIRSHSRYGLASSPEISSGLRFSRSIMSLTKLPFSREKLPTYSLRPARSRESHSGIFGKSIRLNSLDEKNIGSLGNGNGELPGGLAHNLGEVAMLLPLSICC